MDDGGWGKKAGDQSFCVYHLYILLLKTNLSAYYFTHIHILMEHVLSVFDSLNILFSLSVPTASQYRIFWESQ